MKTLTEKDYRKLKKNSSSSLKEFAIDRRKYYRKYILDEDVEEKPNKASDMGRIVETLLWEPDRFDEMFFMSTLEKIPGGMLGEMIHDLAKKVAKHTDDEGVLKKDFNDLALEAYNATDFKIGFEAVMKKLDSPENELYYKECLKVHYHGMTLVTAQDIENAEQIVFTLKNNPNTGDIVTLTSGASATIEVIDQLKLDSFYIDDMELKAMLDRTIILHDKKRIKPFDLKCTWSVENFYKEYYLFRRAYIQAYLYTNGLRFLTKDKSHPWYGYEVENLKFIVCDSINYYDPLIYTISDEDMKEAYEGFEHKGTKYAGVKQIIEELKWAIENDKWTISKTNADKKGVLNIKE